MNEQILELLNALDEMDKVEQDMALKLLMIQEYYEKKRVAQHRIDKARRELRDSLKSHQP